MVTVCRRLRFACRRLSIVGRLCRPASVDVGMPSPRNKTAWYTEQAGNVLAAMQAHCPTNQLQPNEQATMQSNNTYRHASSLPDESATTEWAAVQFSDTCCHASTLPDESATTEWAAYSQATLAALQAHCPMSQQSANGTGCGAVQRCLTAGKRSAACGRRAGKRSAACGRREPA